MTDKPVVEHTIQRSHSLSDLSYIRLITITCFFCLAFIIIASKLIAITAGMNSASITSSNPVYQLRKEITDRNGVLLAVDLSTASLYANPKNIFKPKLVAKKLHKIFPDMSYKFLLRKLTHNKNFVWIKRNVIPKYQHAVNNLGVPGLMFKSNKKRTYLHANLFAHILGYVDVDGRGIAGLEKYYNKFLSMDVHKDKLAISLDVRVQNIAHEVLDKYMKFYQADGAVASVVDVNSGEVYAMVSLPDYNPHYPNKASKKQLFNRATLGVYELGSVFKPITVAMALDSGSVHLKDVFFVKKPIKIEKFLIKDIIYKKDWLSIPEIMMYSSNIGLARVSLNMGGIIQRNYIKKMALDRELNLELPEKSVPLMPKSNSWNGANVITISYGYGLAISPMHLLKAFSAIVNGGRLYPLTIIKDKNKQLDYVERVINRNVSLQMCKMLRLSVAKGIAQRADIHGYYVGGKTGSANRSSLGGYDMSRKISSFIAAFPMYKPKFAVYVMVDNPKAKYKYMTMSSRVAAPAVKEIIAKIAPILNIVPKKDYDNSIKQKLQIDYDSPNFTLKSF